MRTAEDYIDSVLQYMPPGTPLRKQIALELRGHFAEREANGQSVEEIARQLGDPARLAESYLSAVPLKKVGFRTRMAAKVLDWCAVAGAVLAIFLPVALLIWYLGYEPFLSVPAARGDHLLRVPVPRLHHSRGMEIGPDRGQEGSWVCSSSRSQAPAFRWDSRWCAACRRSSRCS